MHVFKLWTILQLSAVTNNIVAVYNVDENLTPVLLSTMHTCFMSDLLVLVLVLVSRELVLTLALVLLQLVLTTALDVTFIY